MQIVLYITPSSLLIGSNTQESTSLVGSIKHQASNISIREKGPISIFCNPSHPECLIQIQIYPKLLSLAQLRGKSYSQSINTQSTTPTSSSQQFTSSHTNTPYLPGSTQGYDPPKRHTTPTPTPKSERVMLDRYVKEHHRHEEMMICGGGASSSTDTSNKHDHSQRKQDILDYLACFDRQFNQRG